MTFFICYYIVAKSHSNFIMLSLRIFIRQPISHLHPIIWYLKITILLSWSRYFEFFFQNCGPYTYINLFLNPHIKDILKSWTYIGLLLLQPCIVSYRTCQISIGPNSAIDYLENTINKIIIIKNQESSSIFNVQKLIVYAKKFST